MNVGYEATGKGAEFTRPVVIVKKFNKNTALVVPLTTTSKGGKYYFSLQIPGIRPSKANLSQLRLIDSRRLAVKYAVVPEEIFEGLKKQIARVAV